MSTTACSTFRDLHVWQKSHRLVLAIYAVTASFPNHELFGLVSQMRRASYSVPANIAEGFRRRSRMDKVRFLNISESSLEELRYYLLLAADLGLVPQGHLSAETDEVSRMLSSYERTILASARLTRLRTVFMTSVFCILSSVF
jgi:four helix bundle protein